MQNLKIKITHFITLTLWENWEAIKKFAGEDVNMEEYYEEDKDFLTEFKSTVEYYEIVGKSDERCNSY